MRRRSAQGPATRIGRAESGHHQLSRPDHIRLARLSDVPIPLRGHQQPARHRARAARPGTPRHLAARWLWQGLLGKFRSTLNSIKASVSAARPRGRRIPQRREPYKLGADYPYARVPRAFVRQTIDLGGDTEKVAADINQFAGSQTANRLVLTIGKFAVVDIFDTNKYANNGKSDFLNWSLVNAGSFDYAADAWGYTYGAAAEWYQGRWTLARWVFDMSVIPAGGVSPAGFALDPTFRQFELVGEIEERHELWGQPGKLKITGFVSRGGPENSRTRSRSRKRPACPPTSTRCAPTPAGRASASIWSSKSPRRWACYARRLGRRQCRTVGFHRHRPHRIGRGRNHRETMGPAGRHRRRRRRSQRHFRRACGISQRRRARHPDRRRRAAASRRRGDHRDVLQLRFDRGDEVELRLSVHRQSGLQYRSRAGVGFRRAVSHAVLRRSGRTG